MDKENKTFFFWPMMTFISSIFHYVHNIIHWYHYPEPNWLNPNLVDQFWFLMTPFAIIGIVLEVSKRKSASIFFMLYALMNLLTLGHYGVKSDIQISFTIHFFIWYEAICAFILTYYIIRTYYLTK